MKPHTLILGIGNPLMADDGAGIQVVDRLRQEKLPDDVQLRDGGTAGLALVSEMEGIERLILVDCATMAPCAGRRCQAAPLPGEWKRVRIEDTTLLNQEATQLSLHDANLRDALLLAEALDLLPREVILYGIQPANVAWDRPMSVKVSAAIPAVAQAILQEVTEQPTVPPAPEGRHFSDKEV